MTKYWGKTIGACARSRTKFRTTSDTRTLTSRYSWPITRTRQCDSGKMAISFQIIKWISVYVITRWWWDVNRTRSNSREQGTRGVRVPTSSWCTWWRTTTTNNQSRTILVREKRSMSFAMAKQDWCANCGKLARNITKDEGESFPEFKQHVTVFIFIGFMVYAYYT